MQSLASNVFLETQYPGVTLGALALPHGLIQIDAPPALDDGRSWRASLLGVPTGPERLLINLDSHPDRTLGVRAMECTVLAHEKTATVFRNRPNTFKTQGEDTGAEWELLPPMGNIRWAPPDLTFTHSLKIVWSNTEILLEHHAGPTSGAIWTILPQEQIVFVGDVLLQSQPPYFAAASIPDWLDSLKELESERFAGYRIIGGRNGILPASLIPAMRAMLEQTHTRMQQFAARKAQPEETAMLIPDLLTITESPSAQRDRHAQRLRYGLAHYYIRNYFAPGQTEEEE
jgi:glyoxylase-like metal-dependent hydrolase (beta-lactamase superfamily II)